jgi:hypothetical protein
VTDRKALSRAYKENPPAMGVYRVRDTVTGGYFLGSALNVPGILNRTRFSLEMGNDRCHELQRAWNEHGEAALVFEVLDTLDASDDPAADRLEEVRVLEDMWRTRLEATDGPAWTV